MTGLVEMLAWVAGALIIAGYMLVALVKPERF